MKELAIHKPKYRAQQQAYQQGGIHDNRQNSHVSDHYGQNLPRTGQAFTTANLPPLPHAHQISRPSTPQRGIDNRPAWQTRNQASQRVAFNEEGVALSDAQRKKSRLWVFSAVILEVSQHIATPPMPIEVDNGLPGIELWFGREETDEIGLLCHMDTCAAMNTGNLAVHQWLITTQPHLVAEYIQFDDSRPFEPLQLHCAVEDLSKTESMHGKLTAIVRYWMRYTQNGKRVILSFGLGDSVSVNSLVGIPTIKEWKSIFDFESNMLVARGINTKFPMIYEATKQGLPPGVAFSSADFVRPMQGSTDKAIALLTNLSEDIADASTSLSDAKSSDLPSTTVTQTTGEGYVRRQVNIDPIE